VKLDRRQFLATGGAGLASCAAGAPLQGSERTARLDLLLEAHAEVLPERVGAGANHYPMAAEALEALGHEDAIEDSWLRGAAGYAGELPRVAPIEGEIESEEDALGSYERFGDWLDHFRAALARAPWRSVVAGWAPRLAPGIAGATFHGVIRSAHAVRALRQRESEARKNELAVGLAYWAARYTELPVDESLRGDGRSLRATLAGLEHPWLDQHEDVDFFAVVGRLTAAPLAPPVALEERDTTPRAELELLVREAASAFLEMLVLERQRIWLLHTVTGPAAVDLLLPEVDRAGARRLVEHARQAVVALYAAYGAPYTADAHVRESPGEWPALTRRAAETRSVHTIKLIEALARLDRGGDPLFRSVAAQWLEWK
jgi:hypothetical protein